MGTHFAVGLSRFVVLLLTGFSLHAAEPILTVSPEASRPTATSFRFWLTALNPSAQAIHWQPPVELHCTATSTHADIAILAQRVGTLPDTTVQPGTFARVEYQFSLPANATNDITVRVREVPGMLITYSAAADNTETPVPVQSGGLVYFLRGRGDAANARNYEPNQFFKEHISGHEPLYFLAGTKTPNAKFQISFKYRLLNEHGWLAEAAPLLGGLHLAYSQTSLWDLDSRSAPFFDSSYRPEVLFSKEEVFRSAQGFFTLDVEGGVQHESNGRDGADSRSLNIAYLRPRFTFGSGDGLQLSLAPRAWVYVGDLSDNPDIEDYRGYVDLRAVIGWKRGLQVSALGRLGDDSRDGSVTVDATYPLMQPPYGALSLYLHAQYFTGYGESLIGYRERTEQFRAGISLFR
ncbi:MAG TPA: phospholipase A [Verrucomicrobiae bacterium]|nr:phospholipase A [Verrucomicrobiae bacterium]